MFGSLLSKAVFAVLVARETYGSAHIDLAYQSNRALPPRGALDNSGGSGPYEAHYFEDLTFPKHTIFQPKNTTGIKLPVVIWGNGGCYADGGTTYQRFLWQVASYGVTFISPGTILGESNRGRTNATWMTGAIDWITKVAGKGNYTHIDPSRIAAWGQSCGGTEALANAQDPRISSIGVFDSGSRTDTESKAIVGKISKPIFYFIGGVSDSAYPSAERDYTSLPTTTPAWKGNNDRGHMNTFGDPDGGGIANGAIQLAQWLLRGNQSAAAWFIGAGAKEDGFTDVVHRNLEKINVTPI